MTRSLWMAVAVATAFVSAALLFAWQLLSANLPCVTAHFPVLGGIAGDGNPCTRSPSWLPVPGWLLGTLAAAALMGLLITGASAAVQMLWRTRRLVRTCLASRRSVSSAVAEAVLGCAFRDVNEVDHRVNAFCYGIFHPAVVVSRDLVCKLDEQELHAVVQHEAAHAEARHPASLLLARALSRLLFFLPSVEDLVRHHQVAIEIEADRRALAATNRKALAGALSKVATPIPSRRHVALGTFDPLAERLEHLATGQIPSLHSNRLRLIATATVIALMGAGWWWSRPVAQTLPDREVVEVPAVPNGRSSSNRDTGATASSKVIPTALSFRSRSDHR